MDDTTSGSDTTGEPFALEELWRVSSTVGAVESLCLDANDDIVMVGSRTTFTDQGDAYVAKISADGELLWRTDLEVDAAATFLYDVTCAPDGTIYAAGSSGENFSLSSPHLFRLDGASGEVLWSFAVRGSSQEGAFQGVVADDSGVFVVGRRDEAPSSLGQSILVAHYAPDGTEVWTRTISGRGQLHSVLLHEGTLLAAGFAQPDSFVTQGVVIAYDLAGNLGWSQELGPADSRLTHFATDPSTGELWLAGSLDDEDQWAVWSCTFEGCGGGMEVLSGSLHRFDGFVIDHDGRWVITRGDDLYGYDHDGTRAWIHDPDLSVSFLVERRNVIIDSAGAYLVAGQDDADHPTLVKLVAASG